MAGLATGFTWILALLCAAGGHLSSASPVVRSALLVQDRHNVSLTCNLASSSDVTWYHLRSDQLLPLLTVAPSNVREDVVSYHTANSSRVTVVGAVSSGLVDLHILEVKEEDAGVYFCSGRCSGAVCVSRGVRVAVEGADVESIGWPCWSVGFCVVPASLTLCAVIIVGVYLCSGRPAVCCCPSVRSSSSVKVEEGESLHYSSLNLAHKPRPSGKGATGLVTEDVTYATVASRKSPHGSHDHR
uniref:uncharacterized protein LOC124074711 isoform X2 n=1 Tax=Scatophagus argus TaxID=75038 RepID=UPI001ED820A5|nr:uncharacterized protein LOC124074711 isoform X2 [Scatophagus argus]